MAVSCWALVPIKSRSECKGRLAARLAPAARLALVRLMLESVLAALQGARTIDRIAVVTPERDTLPSDVLVIADPCRGLNAALDFGREALIDQGAEELVILPADLPLAGSSDVDTLVERGRRTGFALAPDAAGTGTNALYLAPPVPFRFAFGHGSCSMHVEEARRAGRGTEIVRTPGLELDIDRVEDLDRLLVLGDARAAQLRTIVNGGPWLPMTRFG